MILHFSMQVLFFFLLLHIFGRFSINFSNFLRSGSDKYTSLPKTSFFVPISNSKPAIAPRSDDNSERCWLLVSIITSLNFKYSLQLPSFFLSLNNKLKVLIIAVLKGGIMVGCKKDKILATEGSSPLIF